MNSSLANWDGSLSPQRAVPPSPTPLPAQNSNSSSNNGSPQLASTSQSLGLDIVKNSGGFENWTPFDAPQHRGVGGGSNEQAASHYNTNSMNQAPFEMASNTAGLQMTPEKSSSRNQSAKLPIPSLRYTSMSRSAPSLLNDNASFRQASFAPSPPHSLPSSSPSSFGSQGVPTASSSLPSFGAPGPALSAPSAKSSFPTNASWLQTPNKGTPNPSANSSPLSSLGSSSLSKSWWTGANIYAGQDSAPRDLPQQRKVKPAVRAKKTGNASGSDQSKQQLFDSLAPSSPPPPADARALFTPSPPPEDAPLFTPPSSPTQVRRPPPRPGVGVARRVVRDSDVPTRLPTQSSEERRPRRKTRVYVAVPPAPYAIKRARTSKEGQRGRERQQLPEKGKSGRSRSSDVEVRSGSHGVRRKGRRSRGDDDEEEDSGGEGRMSRSASRGTSKRLPKAKSQNEAEVHSSIGDALNNAWANNEARGTYTVWRASGIGRGNDDKGRGSSGNGKQKRWGEEREEDEEEYRAKKKRARGEKTRKLVWRPVDVREQPREREGSTAKRRRQQPSEEAAASSASVPVRRTGAWCEEFDEDGQRKTRLRFDIDTAEADQVACEALVRGGYFGLLALAEGAVTRSGMEVRQRQQRRPCVVWPMRSQSEVGVSAGAPVVWRSENEEEGAERQAPEEGLKKSRRKVSMSGPEQVSRGHSMQQLLAAPPPASVSQSIFAGPSNPPNTSSAPPLSPVLYMDFSKPNPKPEQRRKDGKSRALPAPSISRPLTPTPTPTQGSGASSNVEQPSREGMTTADSELGSNGFDAEQEEADEQPMPLSEKARGKQKVVDMDVDGQRTPSPEPMSAWINDSGSRGQWSASRERGARSSPILDISPFYNNNPPQQSPPKLHDLLPLPLNDSELPHLRGTYHSFENDMPYGDGTIDPSLLGGMDGDGQMMNTVDEPDLEEYIHSPMQEEVPEADSFSSQSSQSSSSSFSPTSPKILPAPVLPAAADSSSELRTSRRRPAQRRMPDYLVSSEFPDLADDSASSSSVYADESIPAPKAKAKAGTKSKQTAVAVKRRGVNGGGGGGTKVTDVAIPVAYDADRFFRYSGPPWPRGDPEAMCHQCRNKTKLLNVKFEECAHAYCVRCIMVKYEANTVPFASRISSECCPRCNGTCSCDNCTSRRGEVYQFGRSYRPQVPIEKTTTGPRALATARSQHNPYKMLEELVIAPTTYNAILYDLSGAPMARTYHGADGNKDVLVAQPIKKRPRVFVGAVQEAWELGPDPIVYVEPPPAPIQKRKQGHRARTFYVGDPSVLSLPVRTPSTNARQCDIRNERRLTTARTVVSLMPKAGPSSLAVPPVSVQDEMDVDDVPPAISATALVSSSSSDQLAAVDALTAATTNLSMVGSELVDPPITVSPAEDNDIHGLALPEGQARRSLAGRSSRRSSAGTEALVTPPPAPASNGTTSRSPDPFDSPLTSVANSDDIADQGGAGESSPSATTTAAEEDGEQESQKISMGLSLEFGPAVFLPSGTSAVAGGDEVQSSLLPMEVQATSFQALDEAQDPTFSGDSQWGGADEPADCLATSTDTAREEAVTQSLQMVGMHDAEHSDATSASQNPATFMGTADDTVLLKSTQPNGVASCDMGVVSEDSVPLTNDELALAISLGLQALGTAAS